MNLREYLRALRRGWLILVLGLVLGAGAGAGAALIQPPVYQSTSAVYVSIPTASDVSELSLGNSYAQGVVKSFADIATKPYVLDGVIRQLSLEETPARLAESIAASTPLDESVIEITVSDSSPQRAARIANAVTSRMTAAFAALSPSSTVERSAIKVTQVQSALPPTERTSPSLRFYVLGGAAAGLLIALVVIVIVEWSGDRLREPEEVARLTDRALIGTTFLDHAMVKQPLVVRADPQSASAEAFRALRTNLQFLQLTASGPAFVITSAVAGEGKTTTAANLGAVTADAGERVLVVDADLRRPTLAQTFGMPAGPGLTDVLLGRVTLDEAIVYAGASGPALLRAGSIPPNPSELLQSDPMIDVLERLSRRFDLVLLDAPPTLPVTDAAVLAQRTSGAIVVAAAGTVRRPQLREAVDRLSRGGVGVVGIVVTMVQLSRAEQASYRYAEAPPVPQEAGASSRSAALRAGPRATT